MQIDGKRYHSEDWYQTPNPKFILEQVIYRKGIQKGKEN
jgi:hypothetical protein